MTRTKVAEDGLDWSRLGGTRRLRGDLTDVGNTESNGWSSVSSVGCSPMPCRPRSAMALLNRSTAQVVGIAKGEGSFLSPNACPFSSSEADGRAVDLWNRRLLPAGQCGGVWSDAYGPSSRLVRPSQDGALLLRRSYTADASDAPTARA